MENQNDHFRLNQLHSPHPEITQTDARRMLQEFHTLYNTAEGEGRSLYPAAAERDKGRRRTVRRRLLAAAAAACLTLLLICTAVGFDNVYQMLVAWTSDILTIENRQESDTQQVAPTPATPAEDTQYATLQEALTAYGITAPVAPSYIPEIFDTETVTVDTLGNTVFFTASYEAGDDRLSIDVFALGDPRTVYYEKDDTQLVEYVKGGITHYLYNNNASSCAVWHTGNLECCIITSLSRDEVIAMVDSIYE